VRCDFLFRSHGGSRPRPKWNPIAHLTWPREVLYSGVGIEHTFGNRGSAFEACLTVGVRCVEGVLLASFKHRFIVSHVLCIRLRPTTPYFCYALVTMIERRYTFFLLSNPRRLNILHVHRNLSLGRT
jgi:hypothetical protein